MMISRICQMSVYTKSMNIVFIVAFMFSFIVIAFLFDFIKEKVAECLFCVIIIDNGNVFYVAKSFDANNVICFSSGDTCYLVAIFFTFRTPVYGEASMFGVIILIVVSPFCICVTYIIEPDIMYVIVYC